MALLQEDVSQIVWEIEQEREVKRTMDEQRIREIVREEVARSNKEAVAGTTDISNLLANELRRNQAMRELFKKLGSSPHQDHIQQAVTSLEAYDCFLESLMR
jgi:hypothetical protein